MAPLVLDTSVLIFDWQPERAAAVSAVSVGELHAGVALAPNAPEERRRRLRLGEILCVYAVLVVDLDVARAIRRPGRLLPPDRRSTQPRGPADRRDCRRPRGGPGHDRRAVGHVRAPRGPRGRRAAGVVSALTIRCSSART